MVANVLISSAISSGSPENGRRDPSGEGAGIVERRLVGDRQHQEIVPLGLGQALQRVQVRAHLQRRQWRRVPPVAIYESSTAIDGLLVRRARERGLTVI